MHERARMWMAWLVGAAVLGTSGNALADDGELDSIDGEPPNDNWSRFDDTGVWSCDMGLGVRRSHGVTLTMLTTRAGLGWHGIYGGIDMELAAIVAGAPLVQPKSPSSGEPRTPRPTVPAPAGELPPSPTSGIPAQVAIGPSLFVGVQHGVGRFELAFEVAGGALVLFDIRNTADTAHWIGEARARVAVRVTEETGVGAWVGKSLVNCNDWMVGAGLVKRTPQDLRLARD